MRSQRKEIIHNLEAMLRLNGHIMGAVVGSGMIAQAVEKSGIDFELALSAGRYRIAGKGSMGSYMCYGSSNRIVEKFASEEVLPIVKRVPVLFGLFCQDPEIRLYEYLKKIKKLGFAGITNFPTIALIDGQFREALEEEGNSYDVEVEAIRLAHFLDMFTVAFVTNEEETSKMIDAGADIICAHMGLTHGGMMGSQKHMTLEDARKLADRIFSICSKKNANVINMIYSGPANTPIDMQYLYKTTACQGYIGGSVFDRIPVERAITNTVRSFKAKERLDGNDPWMKLMQEKWQPHNCVEFVKEYVEEYYNQKVYLNDLATVIHMSPSHLSVRFKNEMGMNFSEYLLQYRLKKACDLLVNSSYSCKEVAYHCGFEDYVHFTKTFKKKFDVTPKEFRKSNKNTTDIKN